MADATLDVNKVKAGEVWRLVTCHFVHDAGAFLPVAMLCVALYVVAGRLEGVHGWREFLAVVVCGVVVISAANVAAAIGAGGADPTYGAGPLVAVLLVLYACHHPYETVNMIVPVPMWAVAAGVIGLDLLAEVNGGGHAGRVGYLAGAGFAVAYYAAGWRVSNVLFPRTLAGQRRPRPVGLKAYAAAPPDPATRTVAAPDRPADRLTDEQLEAKLDQVLEKVARSGQASLTVEEQTVLQRASEIFKRRQK